MSTSPASIRALRDYWIAQGGVSLGIVGSSSHTYGYHLGADRIYGPTGQGSKDYSVRTARDKAGLTNAASAFDIGAIDGSYRELWRFSLWLVGRCRANAPGTRDIREVIYSPDGVDDYRWDRQNGVTSLPVIHTGSDHIRHSHIGFYRDSENRDKVGLVRPYFQPDPPDTSTEGPMGIIEIDTLPWGGRYTIPAGVKPVGLRLDANGAVIERKEWPGSTSPSSGSFDAFVDLTGIGIRGNPFFRVVDGFFAGYYVSSAGLISDPGDDPTPFSQSDLDQAQAAEQQRWDAWVATRPK